MEIINIYPDNSNILIIGSLPPPFGGVSIHIHRLAILLRENKHNVYIFNMSKSYAPGIKYFLLLWKILNGKFDIIHLHTSLKKPVKTVHLLKKIKRYKVFFTDHNPRLFESIDNKYAVFLKDFIKTLDYLILVTSQIMDIYLKNKVPLPVNYLIKKAFLPPSLSDKNEITKKYSTDVFDFIQTHSPVLLANAYKISFYKEEDLYGLDLCINLTAKLKKYFPNIGFFFALADKNNNRDYINAMKLRINELEISENFFFSMGQINIWPLFNHIHLFLRPTNTDGDSLSIREALYFNCPVLASNVCPRPEQCHIFENRNQNDLFHRTKSILFAYNKTF